MILAWTYTQTRNSFIYRSPHILTSLVIYAQSVYLYKSKDCSDKRETSLSSSVWPNYIQSEILSLSLLEYLDCMWRERYLANLTENGSSSICGARWPRKRISFRRWITATFHVHIQQHCQSRFCACIYLDISCMYLFSQYWKKAFLLYICINCLASRLIYIYLFIYIYI